MTKKAAVKDLLPLAAGVAVVVAIAHFRTIKDSPPPSSSSGSRAAGGSPLLLFDVGGGYGLGDGLGFDPSLGDVTTPDPVYGDPSSDIETGPSPQESELVTGQTLYDAGPSSDGGGGGAYSSFPDYYDTSQPKTAAPEPALVYAPPADRAGAGYPAPAYQQPSKTDADIYVYNPIYTTPIYGSSSPYTAPSPAEMAQAPANKATTTTTPWSDALRAARSGVG